MEYITISEDDIKQMLIINEQIEIEKIINNIQYISNHMREKMIKYINPYIIEKITLIQQIKSLQERTIEYLLFKITIYYLIIIVKIKLASVEKKLTLFDVKKIKEISVDDIAELLNKGSITEKSTKKIYDTQNLTHIENYIHWLKKKAFHLKIEELVCFVIILKRLCYNNNEEFFSWLKDNYDISAIVIIILIKKMYGHDNCYLNLNYASKFSMNITDINQLEIAILMNVNIYISEKEYNETLNEIYLENIN